MYRRHARRSITADRVDHSPDVIRHTGYGGVVRSITWADLTGLTSVPHRMGPGAKMYLWCCSERRDLVVSLLRAARDFNRCSTGATLPGFDLTVLIQATGSTSESW